MTWVDSVDYGLSVEKDSFPCKCYVAHGTHRYWKPKGNLDIKCRFWVPSAHYPAWLEFCLQLKMDTKDKELDWNLEFLQSSLEM